MGMELSGGERRLKYATETGTLYGPKGEKLAHCSAMTREEMTIDVNDSKYAAGPYGLRHKTGNVCEWVERELTGERPYDIRGGSWREGSLGRLLNSYREINGPFRRSVYAGFRVGAPAARLEGH
jgi:formylglycine-generating enzyme required for sulfatase activity